MCTTLIRVILGSVLMSFTVFSSGMHISNPQNSNLSNGNIILNPDFENGLSDWTGKGCEILLHESMADGKIVPMSGKFFASATGRTDTGNGMRQELTGRVKRKLAYEVTAVVRVYGNSVTQANVQVTLWVQPPDLSEQFIAITRVSATDSEWVQMQGNFIINGFPSRVAIFLEGPPPGTDILLDSLMVKHAAKRPVSPRLAFKVPDYGVNIVENSNFNDGTCGWFPHGNCTLSVGTGSPVIVPPLVEQSLGRPHQPLSGLYVRATNRTQPWAGPSQMITERIKLYMTYQVSAWIRIGPGSSFPQPVNVAVIVDDQWFNGGYMEINDDDTWHEITGSFRIEKQPTSVMVYVQGPDAGIDLIVAGLQIFAVNRQARFKYLKEETDKVRKRSVILKLTGGAANRTKIKVKQTENSFPIGSCVSRSNIDNEDFVAFFVKHFTWSVFENELKWYYTEPQQGKLNYKDADDLLNFCTSHNIQVRGHCIFWEEPAAVQQWVRDLNNTDLMTAVHNHLTGLVTRYKGKFKHYDVDNEMLHSSFYKDRLGDDIRSFMFKTTNQLDPYPALFVNDYHIEDGYDNYRSSPEKYIQLVLDLQKKGAPVGGIGIQGHIDFPVGTIVRSALDKLATLELPIWFTELDVSSNNEYIRADDLEVVFREAFAHPAVDGIVLWGFWELLMNRQNAFLVNAEGDLNEAGRRFVALKKEWLSSANGHIDQQGQFSFRGYQGSYRLEIGSGKGKITKSFVVEKGQDPQLITINI